MFTIGKRVIGVPQECPECGNHTVYENDEFEWEQVEGEGNKHIYTFKCPICGKEFKTTHIYSARVFYVTDKVVSQRM